MITQNFKNSSGKYPVTTETLEMLQNQAKLCQEVLPDFLTNIASKIFGENEIYIILCAPRFGRQGAILANKRIFEWFEPSSTHIKLYNETKTTTVNGEQFSVERQYFASCSPTDSYALKVADMPSFDTTVGNYKSLDIVPKNAILIWDTRNPLPTGYEYIDTVFVWDTKYHRFIKKI